jgi:hypothetical protein
VTTATATVPRARAPWRAVAVPVEHGGWSLTLEPAVLGLVVAPSAAGLAIALAALVAFVARTPLRVVLVDRRRGRHLDRTALAARLALAELAVLAVLAGIAALLASGAFWVPLLAATPLVAVELAFARRSRSRRLVPELAGAAAMGSVAAAVILAGGGPARVGAAAWLAVAARVGASIPFARYQLGRSRTRATPRWWSDAAQVGAVALAAGGALVGWLPPAGLVAVVLLAATQLVLARTEPPKAAVLGTQQLVLGLAVALTTAFAL